VKKAGEVVQLRAAVKKKADADLMLAPSKKPD
jgi:hypothetical protein